MAEDESWFCYMVRCRDGSFYVATANDVDERVKRHNWGVGPGYTGKRRPVVLVWRGLCGSCDLARWRENQIKGWNREKKFELVRKWEKERVDRRLR